MSAPLAWIPPGAPRRCPFCGGRLGTGYRTHGAHAPPILRCWSQAQRMGSRAVGLTWLDFGQ
jgi:hypothetical protein